MNQWRKIVIFIVVLVLLVGVLIGTSIYKNKKAGEVNVTPTPSIDPVVSVEEKDVSKITLNNSNGELVFTPGTGMTSSGDEAIEWNLSLPAGLLYSKTTISSKISYYTQITADTVVSTSMDNLAEYGLDKPVATVTILLKSGDTKKIIYGNASVGDISQYVMLEGSGRICTTSTGNASAAMIKSLDLLDTAVLKGFTKAQVKELQFKRKKDQVDMVAKSNNDASADGQTPATWKIISPIKADANLDGFTVFIDQLVTITADSFIEIAPKDLAKYGLDLPNYDITLIGDSMKVHCILGASAGNGSVYGYSDYMDAVFVVSTASLTSIDKPFIELMNSFVFMASIWEVSGIDIKVDDLSIHCDIKDDQEKTNPSDFKVNGADANVVNSSDDSYFRGFYQSLISIYAKGIDVSAKPVYQPSVTIDYIMKDVTKNTQISFVKRDETTYYAFINKVYQGYYVNGDDFYSEKKDDEGIIPAFKILQNAIQNQVNGVYQ